MDYRLSPSPPPSLPHSLRNCLVSVADFRSSSYNVLLSSILLEVFLVWFGYVLGHLCTCDLWSILLPNTSTGVGLWGIHEGLLYSYDR
ncbi:hypothetical protein K474DRAFT_1670656 [Panus rudis PR-1116 ss-1]|nr:hypothetical protein K474DRAFT_1670656 [Panus rudis PR-1116 ss-1]